MSPNIFLSGHLVVLRLQMSYSILQRDKVCRHVESGLLSGCLKSLEGRAEAGQSQLDKNDLGREHLLNIGLSLITELEMTTWQYCCYM